MTTTTRNALTDYINAWQWSHDLALTRGGISKTCEVAKVNAAFARLVEVAGSKAAAKEAIRSR